METSNVNEVKIYNLSSGKSVPDWLSSRKKRKMVKRDASLRNRIELIQDFEMPGVSTCIRLAPDGQHILAVGVYKPRVRCYDAQQLAMKFERCVDSEVVTFDVLSEDYSKLVFLQCDRYVELHSQNGRYHRIRIPKAGHDMSYHQPSCDLYLVGAACSVFRLNLEQGCFLESFETESSCLNVCEVNPAHHLFVCGSEEGTVEAWDPRCSARVGRLDCALNSVTSDMNVEGMPSVTSLAFRDGLNLAVGTATGQILVYDLRSSKPYLVKDHLYGLPIKGIKFLPSLDLVASMDSKILKIWERSSGKAYTAIQTQSDLNDLCVVPDTGMLFLANEDKKMLTYYIPSIGPAPKWCSFLDRIVEELEETNENPLYDDYKFVTGKELESLGLNHLIGTNLLRAYMHGFFLDMRLYHKARAVADPFAYEEYRKRKIKAKIEAERSDRVQIKSQLPKVNRDLAQKLMEKEMEEKVAVSAVGKEKKSAKGPQSSLLRDDRFKAMFENPDFQVDQQSDEYKSFHYKPS